MRVGGDLEPRALVIGGRVRYASRPHVPVGSTLVGAQLSMDAGWSTVERGSGIAAVDVEVRSNGGAWVSLATPATASSVGVSGRVGGSVQLRVRATDGAGNPGAWRYGPDTAIRATQETSSAIVQTGSWRRRAIASAYGGAVDASWSAGSRATYRFTGRGVAILSTLGPKRGKADIYIDGARVARIDGWASSFRSRRIVFSAAWPTSGTHKLQIRVIGTPGRPRVDLDAILVLR